MFFAYFSSICGPILVKLWPPCSPWRWQNLGKKIPVLKTLIIGLSKYIETKSPLPFLGKLDYFFHFWVENRWASQVKWSESKFNAAYFTEIVVDQLNPRKFWFQHFAVWLLFWRPRPNLWKKMVMVPDAEFNPEWIGTNLKSQKWKTKKLVCPFLLAPFHFETNLINGFPFVSDNCGQFGNFFLLSLK